MPVRPAPKLSEEGLRNSRSSEAYFSNYIEGTEFVVEEAADIVFRNKPMPTRPADAHDILGTFRIVSNSHEMGRVPGSANELLDLLKTRHAVLLAGRPEKNPGSFKETVNRAGRRCSWPRGGDRHPDEGFRGLPGNRGFLGPGDVHNVYDRRGASVCRR